MTRWVGSDRRSVGLQLPRWLSLGVLGGLASAAWWAPGGCAGPLEEAPGTPPATEGDVLGQTLANTGSEVILPALRDASAASQALADAVDVWVASPEGSAERDAARAAWEEAMAAWQVVEVMQVGPAASSLTAAGGEDIRDYVYSWPTVNPCRVDQETVETDYASGSFVDDELVNVLGLDALEHLLWAGDGNVCPSQVAINADGTWDDMGDSERAAARAAYAQVLADDVVARSSELVGAWEGGFADELAGGTGVYSSQAEALNALFDGLFYLEKTTKDRKLGTPLGLVDCAEATCPDDAESLPSGTSHLWLAANLDGFRRVFVGGEGWGFDDLLVEQGHDDLAVEVVARLDEADAAVAALTAPIDEGVQSDLATVEAAHAALKGVGDLLKGDLATVLTLDIPAEAAGDND